MSAEGLQRLDSCSGQTYKIQCLVMYDQVPVGSLIIFPYCYDYLLHMLIVFIQ